MLKAYKHEASSKIRFPYRLHVDHVVDRRDVEVQQCMELTNTNGSTGLTTFFFRKVVQVFYYSELKCKKRLQALINVSDC